MKHIQISILILFLALLYACNGQNNEQKTIQVDYSDPGIDKLLPIFMTNEDNTILYFEASNNSEIVFTLEEYDNTALIGLTAVKDAGNRVWYKCFYPKMQVIGWTNQVSHRDYNEDEKQLPFLQNFTLANLELGANPRDAKRLLGKPISENSETGPLEVSGSIIEDYIVTTTTMEYEGLQLIYQDDAMIHASITKSGKSFGWIKVGDKGSDKDFLIKKFKLTEDDFYVNEEGDSIVHTAMEVLLVSITFDENEFVKTITYNCGP